MSSGQTVVAPVRFLQGSFVILVVSVMKHLSPPTIQQIPVIPLLLRLWFLHQLLSHHRR